MFQDAYLLTMTGTAIALNSCMVIAARCSGMSGLTRQEATEPLTMITEKVDAWQESCGAVMSGVLGMRPPAEVMMRAMTPYHARTEANVQRLCGRHRA